MTYFAVLLPMIFSLLPFSAFATPCPENSGKISSTPNQVVEIRPCIFLKDVSLIRSDLKGALLNSSQFELVDIKESFADKAKLDQGLFRSVRIQRLKAPESSFVSTEWHGGTLKESDLSRSNFSSSTLQGTRWYSTNFSSANLRNVKATNCFLEQVNLEDADLRGAEFQNCIFVGVKLSRARFNKDTKLPMSSAVMAQQGMEFRP